MKTTNPVIQRQLVAGATGGIGGQLGIKTFDTFFQKPAGGMEKAEG
jgi:hypothetical protein